MSFSPRMTRVLALTVAVTGALGLWAGLSSANDQPAEIEVSVPVATEVASKDALRAAPDDPSRPVFQFTYESPYGNSTGSDLADELGLQLESVKPDSCMNWVQLDNGGYCLQGYVEEGVNGFDVWQRLIGHIPTALELKILALGDTIDKLHTGTVTDREEAEARLLEAELRTLMAQQEAAGS